MEKIGFIGCGHMAKALIEGLIENNNYKILGHDRNPNNTNWLATKSIPVFSLDEICHEADIAVVCVKPNDMYDLCQKMSKIISKDLIIVSVAAGVTLQSLNTMFPNNKVFRAMPNIGAKNNLGITSVYSNDDNSKIVEIFNYLGKAFEVQDENQINLHTSLIGSGPAFFFEIINEFENRLSELLPPDVSKRDITLLFLTSLISSIKDGQNIEELILSIKSKGGTTEAGLNLLYDKEFVKIFSDSIDAARDRALDLSMD